MLDRKRLIYVYAGFLLIALIFAATDVRAGLMELGISANHKTSTFDKNNYQNTTSYTGSVSYYFWELSAFELSYTKGRSDLSTKTASDPKIKYVTQFEMLGIDFVYSFAGRQSAFQPYIKFGGAQLQKRIFRELDSGQVDTIGEQKGLVPSAGIGFKLVVAKQFRIKAGMDFWTSPQNADTEHTIDTAARAGFSWLF